MAWLYVPGLAASNSDSTSPNPDIELWVSLSGKHVRRPRSWRGWLTRPWVTLLSGTTLPPSTADAGVDAWISSLRASRASRSASPGSSEESPTNATSGRPSPGSLAAYALSGYCSKTSRVWQQPSLLMDEAPSKPSTTTFAKWVTRSRGTSSQRQRWGRRIFANDSSSWPTPVSDDMSNVSGEVNRDFQSLAALVALWPTPRAEDSEATGAHRGTPDTLNAAAGLWATPAARATKGAYSPGALTRRDGKSRMDLLDNQAVYFQPFRPAASTPSDGGRSSASTPALPRRLNPDFVEWLMGWPIGWTVPGSPLPETEWSRWWRHMRGSLSALGWRI